MFNVSDKRSEYRNLLKVLPLSKVQPFRRCVAPYFIYFGTISITQGSWVMQIADGRGNFLFEGSVNFISGGDLTSQAIQDIENQVNASSANDWAFNIDGATWNNGTHTITFRLWSETYNSRTGLDLIAFMPGAETRSVDISRVQQLGIVDIDCGLEHDLGDWIETEQRINIPSWANGRALRLQYKSNFGNVLLSYDFIHSHTNQGQTDLFQQIKNDFALRNVAISIEQGTFGNTGMVWQINSIEQNFIDGGYWEIVHQSSPAQVVNTTSLFQENPAKEIIFDNGSSNAFLTNRNPYIILALLNYADGNVGYSCSEWKTPNKKHDILSKLLYNQLQTFTDIMTNSWLEHDTNIEFYGDYTHAVIIETNKHSL